MNEQIHSFTSGAASSGHAPRYELIPRAILVKLAQRFGLGAKKYGERKYRIGLADRDFIVDRLNHMQQHLNALVAPSTQEEWDDDNIAALAWACAFLSEVEEHPEACKVLRGIRSERSSLPQTCSPLSQGDLPSATNPCGSERYIEHIQQTARR